MDRAPARARSRSLTAITLCALVAGLAAGEEPPCGVEVPAKPKRIKGGEGVPPLPLPATPLRRTERKRDPAPPLLVGKIRWGRRDLRWKLPDGREKVYGDWNHDPNDIHRLLEALTRELGTKYRAEELDLPGFSFDPEVVPILYAAGLEAFTLREEERRVFREYLLAGGTFLAVAHHGSRKFADSIRREAALLFPESPMAVLPPDHAIYRTHRAIERVSYTPGTTDRPEGAPWLEGVYVGCRVACILSPYDLCCTWDSDHLLDVHPGVKGPDAFALGLDILAYSMAFYPLGRNHGKWGRVEVSDPSVNRGDFVFAQVRHVGHHDPHPAAFASIVAQLLEGSTAAARLERKMVSLSSADCGRYPFLYLTGHDDFRLSDAESAELRRFLEAGGFLLADSCCGSLAFDLAFRRELGRAIEGSRLEMLPVDHPIMTTPRPVGPVEYTTAVRATFGELRAPYLEGLSIDGELRVVYSRFDLGNGWEGEERPFSLAVRNASARALGVNILLYAMTH